MPKLAFTFFMRFPCPITAFSRPMTRIFTCQLFPSLGQHQCEFAFSWISWIWCILVKFMQPKIYQDIISWPWSNHSSTHVHGENLAYVIFILYDSTWGVVIPAPSKMISHRLDTQPHIIKLRWKPSISKPSSHDRGVDIPELQVMENLLLRCTANWCEIISCQIAPNVQVAVFVMNMIGLEITIYIGSIHLKIDPSWMTKHPNHAGCWCA